jgi:hypothetical protein
MADEQCNDECIKDIKVWFKVDVVVCGIDVTMEQVKDRFTEREVALLREIQLFSPAGFYQLVWCRQFLFHPKVLRIYANSTI